MDVLDILAIVVEDEEERAVLSVRLDELDDAPLELMPVHELALPKVVVLARRGRVSTCYPS